MVLCRALKCDTVIARFPDTGPQRLAQFIQTLDLRDQYVHIVDIPINVAAPREHIAALEQTAEKARKLVLWDHHDTDLRFVNELRRTELRYFDSATSMAMAIAEMTEDPMDHTLAFVGVVADRDINILQILDRETVEKNLLPLANTLDVLSRRDAQGSAEKLLKEGVAWLMRQNVDYPPLRLWKKLRIAERGSRSLLLEPVDTTSNKELESWLPKTLETLLLNMNYSYAVIPSLQLDTRTNQPFWSVRVLKYWLSSAPTVTDILKIKNRQVVGHENYISIRATDRDDALQLARTLHQELEKQTNHAEEEEKTQLST